jgi:signal transduction histidine kinase
MRARLGWILFGLTVVVAACHVALLVVSERSAFSRDVIGDGFPLVTVGAVAGAGVGAVIVSRYPWHRIGWLFLVGQLLSELGLALRAYGYGALSGELGSAPGGHLAIWLSVQTGGLFVVALLTILFLLAPDGRLPSARWRWAMALPVSGLALEIGAVSTVAPSELNRFAELAAGDAGPVLTGVLLIANLAVGIGMVAAAVSLTRRLRRARGEERAQLRWMALAAVSLAVGLVVNMLLAAAGAPDWIQPLPVMVAYVVMPFYAGIAILRYRLYDIDLFLNRAILLTALTGFITVGYIAMVLLIATVFPHPQGAFWTSLLAIAVVALVFQPVHEGAQRLADRLVYGRRAAPYLALADFSRRLQEAPGTDELLTRVAEAIGTAVDARHVAIQADLPGRSRVRVTWPADDQSRAPDLTLPAADDDGELGLVSIVMPPGVALRQAEERLLTDFAHQLGRALRNISLESALVQRIEQLRRQTVELAASARRLSSAQVAEQQRFEADLAQTVLPHLRQVHSGLEAVRRDLASSRSAAPDVTRRLDELTSSTNAALESLRTLTRGVFPAQLARRGLEPALTSHVTERGLGAVVHVDPSVARRFDPRVESACYFCAVECLRELDPIEQLRLSESDDVLRLEVAGTARPTFPGRSEHLRDRAAALDGSVDVHARPGGPALIRLEIPLRSGANGVPDLPEPAGVEVGLRDVGAGTAQ